MSDTMANNRSNEKPGVYVDLASSGCILVLTVFGLSFSGISISFIPVAVIFLAVLAGFIVLRVGNRFRKQQTNTGPDLPQTQKLYETEDSIESEMSRLKQALQIGMDRLGKAAYRIDGLVSGTKDGMSMLVQTLDGATQAELQAQIAQNEVKTKLESYVGSSEMTSVGASNLASGVQALAATADSHRSHVRRLIEVSVQAEGRLAEVRNTVDSIGSVAEHMEEVNRVISEVAERTNLLAINASIEAAHVGKVGAGFAVVAGEIRKMSEEARKGVVLISDSLTKTKAASAKSGQATAETQALFRRMIDETNSFGEAFGSLSDRLQNFNEESRSIIQGAVGIKAGGDEARAIVGSAVRHGTEANNALEMVRNVSMAMDTDLKGMLVAIEDLLALIADIKGL